MSRENQTIAAAEMARPARKIVRIAPTPGAAGAAEATFYVLHAPFVDAQRLVVATAAWRLLMFYVPALVAVVAFPALGAVERRKAPVTP